MGLKVVRSIESSKVQAPTKTGATKETQGGQKEWTAKDLGRRTVGAPLPLTPTAQLAQVEAQLDALLNAANAGRLAPEKVYAQLQPTLDALPPELVAATQAKAAQFSAQALNAQGDPMAAQALLAQGISRLKPVLTSASATGDEKLAVLSLMGVRAQYEAQLPGVHERVEQLSYKPQTAENQRFLAQTVAVGEEKLKAAFGEVDDASRKLTFALGSGPNAAQNAPVAESVERYRRQLSAVEQRARAALLGHAGQPDAQLKALEKELGRVLQCSSHQLLKPLEQRTFAASGEEARWHDMLGTTEVGTLSKAQLDEFAARFNSPRLNESDRSMALDAVRRYTEVAGAAGKVDGLNVGHQLLEKLGDASNDERVSAETQLSGSQLALARGDAGGSLVGFHIAEKQLLEHPISGGQPQLQRAVLGQAGLLESLAMHGPADQRESSAKALRALRQKYEGPQADRVDADTKARLIFSEARAFLKTAPKESVATIEHAKEIWSTKGPNGKLGTPDWLKQRLDIFDARFQDAGPIAGLQAVLAETMDATAGEDLKAAATGFVIGGAIGVGEGLATGALAGAAVDGVGAGPGALVGAAIEGGKGGLIGSGYAVAALHAYKGLSGVRRAWDAASTGYNPESLKESLWDGVGLGMVVAGTKLAPIGRSVKTVAEDLSEGLPHATAKLGMNDASRMHYDALHTADEAVVEEFAKLTPQELRRLYPEGGGLPEALHAVAHVPGFAQAVKAAPEAVRTVADAESMLSAYGLDEVDRLVTDQLKVLSAEGKTLTEAQVGEAATAAFRRVANGLEPMLPKVTSHPNKAYFVIRRGELGSDRFPELALQPRGALDHNGAFLDHGRSMTARGLDQVKTETPAFEYPLPSQLIVDGQPLKNLDGVALFGAHGAREGFAGFGLGVRSAAKFVADELIASRAAGKSIDKLILSSCEQRDFRWLTWDSSAQSFAKALNKELVAAGHPPVRVLAAEHAGPVAAGGWQTAGPLVRIENGRPVFGRRSVRSNFTPVEDGGEVRIGVREAALAGAVALGAGAPLVKEALDANRYVEVK